MTWSTLIHRRIEAIKLVFYLLFTEFLSDLRDVLANHLFNILNDIALWESGRAGNYGQVGNTRAWKIMMKL